ncbi:hypothetical protein F5B20DRAFT_534434 [Whalleya microplaca]|nr:hypothetical protein F5B20DRAFT_534434 [Whalleya microplaca]
MNDQVVASAQHNLEPPQSSLQQPKCSDDGSTIALDTNDISGQATPNHQGLPREPDSRKSPDSRDTAHVPKFVCPQCGKAISRKDNLDRHMKLHCQTHVSSTTEYVGSDTAAGDSDNFQGQSPPGDVAAIDSAPTGTSGEVQMNRGVKRRHEEMAPENFSPEQQELTRLQEMLAEKDKTILDIEARLKTSEERRITAEQRNLDLEKDLKREKQNFNKVLMLIER